MKVIFELGGRQHICNEGEVFLADKVSEEEGATFFAERVFSIIDGDTTKVGSPVIEGAKVELKVLCQTRARKVIIQKYKPKVNYRIRKGHKQPITQVKLVKVHA